MMMIQSVQPQVALKVLGQSAPTAHPAQSKIADIQQRYESRRSFTPTYDHSYYLKTKPHWRPDFDIAALRRGAAELLSSKMSPPQRMRALEGFPGKYNLSHHDLWKIFPGLEDRIRRDSFFFGVNERFRHHNANIRQQIQNVEQQLRGVRLPRAGDRGAAQHIESLHKQLSQLKLQLRSSLDPSRAMAEFRAIAEHAGSSPQERQELIEAWRVKNNLGPQDMRELSSWFQRAAAEQRDDLRALGHDGVAEIDAQVAKLKAQAGGDRAAIADIDSRGRRAKQALKLALLQAQRRADEDMAMADRLIRAYPPPRRRRKKRRGLKRLGRFFRRTIRKARKQTLRLTRKLSAITDKIPMVGSFVRGVDALARGKIGAGLVGVIGTVGSAVLPMAAPLFRIVEQASRGLGHLQTQAKRLLAKSYEGTKYVASKGGPGAIVAVERRDLEGVVRATAGGTPVLGNLIKAGEAFAAGQWGDGMLNVAAAIVSLIPAIGAAAGVAASTAINVATAVAKGVRAAATLAYGIAKKNVNAIISGIQGMASAIAGAFAPAEGATEGLGGATGAAIGEVAEAVEIGAGVAGASVALVKGIEGNDFAAAAAAVGALSGAAGSKIPEGSEAAEGFQNATKVVQTALAVVGASRTGDAVGIAQSVSELTLAMRDGLATTAGLRDAATPLVGLAEIGVAGAKLFEGIQAGDSMRAAMAGRALAEAAAGGWMKGTGIETLVEVGEAAAAIHTGARSGDVAMTAGGIVALAKQDPALAPSIAAGATMAVLGAGLHQSLGSGDHDKAVAYAGTLAAIMSGERPLEDAAAFFGVHTPKVEAALLSGDAEDATQVAEQMVAAAASGEGVDGKGLDEAAAGDAALAAAGEGALHAIRSGDGDAAAASAAALAETPDAGARFASTLANLAMNGVALHAAVSEGSTSGALGVSGGLLSVMQGVVDPEDPLHAGLGDLAGWLAVATGASQLNDAIRGQDPAAIVEAVGGLLAPMAQEPAVEAADPAVVEAMFRQMGPVGQRAFIALVEQAGTLDAPASAFAHRALGALAARLERQELGAQPLETLIGSLLLEGRRLGGQQGVQALAGDIARTLDVAAAGGDRAAA